MGEVDVYAAVYAAAMRAIIGAGEPPDIDTIAKRADALARRAVDDVRAFAEQAQERADRLAGRPSARRA